MITDTLRYSGIIPAWKRTEKRSSSTASNSTVTQMQRVTPSVPITSRTPNIGSVVLVACTRKSGNPRTVRFLLGTTSITKIGTHSTTTYRISNVYPTLSTARFTEQTRRASARSRTSLPFVISQRSGMAVMLGARGIRRMAREHGKSVNPSQEHVTSVEQNSSQWAGAIATDSAQTIASQGGDAQPGWMTLGGRVRCVARLSRSTNTAGLKRARQNAERNWRTRNDGLSGAADADPLAWGIM